MKKLNEWNIKIPVALLVLSLVVLASCHNSESEYNTELAYKGYTQNDKVPSLSKDDAIEEPPLSDDIYPCNDCHAWRKPNPKKRELVEWHDEISPIFNHDKENRWCTDCHDLNQRDSLRLANGKLIGFEESYKLCGQCHGNKLRDWKAGVHGKRIGEWNGRKEYFLCVHCHNPHSPKFKPLTPKPAPVRQEEIN